MATGDSRRVAPPAGPWPWLVYYHHKDHKHQMFCCNVTGDGPAKRYRKKIKALHHKEVLLSSSHGWLVLYDDRTKLLSLCNSTTFDAAITLPKLDKLWSPYNYTIDSCVLLSSSRNSTLRDLQVVIFFKSVSSLVHLRLNPGSQGWEEVGYSSQLETLIDEETHKDLTKTGPLFFGGAISCGSKIYAKLELTGGYKYYYIWSIELVRKQEEEEVVLWRLEEDHDVTAITNKIFLSESYGELFLLRTDTIELCRLEVERRVWERVKVVKDRAFFLGKTYCLSCPALECGGRVYCCTESESRNSRLLRYYTMEDGGKVDLRPLPDLPMSSLPPIWILPTAPLRPEDDHDCTQDDNKEGSCSTRAIQLLRKNSTSEQDLNTDERQMLIDLPSDVLVLVSKHLIIPIDYMNFRATSPVSRFAIPPIKWSNPLSGSETSLSVPLLMSANYKNDQHLYEFVDPRPNSNKCNSYLMKIPNSLENSAICYSSGGWVLTWKEGEIYLYNPFTGEVINVTAGTGCWVPEWTHSLFFTPKSDGEYFDAFIGFHFWDKTAVVFTLAPGDEHWTFDRNFARLKSKRGFNAIHSGPIFFEDAFYYLGCDGNLGKLERYVEYDEHYKAGWEVLNKPSNPCDKCFEYSFLVESDGDLLSVFVGRAGEWVSVYWLNWSEMVWETVSSLGNYALYLSRASTMSVKTSSDLGGRIYFPWVGDSGMAFFSLETGEWHFSGGGDSSRDLYGTKLLCNSCWIKPG